MALASIAAYIAVVGEDHTIVLPEEIPVGTHVAITVLPTGIPAPDDEARRKRFNETLATISKAIAASDTLPDLSDAELEALVRKARTAL